MSTYAQRVQLGPFFSGGELQGAAKLYHYEVGSSTLKNVWSDRGMTTTLAQPFVADSQGVFNFFADGLYKLIICGPNSTGPASDVLYTLDDWQFIDRVDPTFSEGPSIVSSSSISVGPEVWAHIAGSTTINTISGTIPFFWAVFDGNLTLTHSTNLLCPGSTNMTVKSGDAVFFLNEGAGAWRVAGQSSQSLLVQADNVIVNASDGRTNTADAPFTVRSVTTNTPTAGIGTGILYQAESADENPCDIGQTECILSDVSAGSEDTYFQILLRRAGAALAAAYRLVATTAFNAIITHANSADRTYTLANRDCTLGHRYDGPTSVGSGSTHSHEGSVTISSNQALTGIHFYSDFTLNAGVTITVTSGGRQVIIVATGTITIAGTINAIGAAGNGVAAGAAGNPGTDQVGGNGSSGGVGGVVVSHGITISSANTQLTGSALRGMLMSPWLAQGSASGGGGLNWAGGAGGGSIVLIAPTIILQATATLNTSGAAGSGGGLQGGGGGGGAGNVYIMCHHFTDNGAAFTMTGGAGGVGTPGTGTAGRDGVKQINIY